MEIIVNQYNLQIDEIKDFNQKVRAILIDGENILVATPRSLFTPSHYL